jgi:hypothetical protein
MICVASAIAVMLSLATSAPPASATPTPYPGVDIRHFELAKARPPSAQLFGSNFDAPVVPMKDVDLSDNEQEMTGEFAPANSSFVPVSVSSQAPIRALTKPDVSRACYPIRC